MMEIGAARFYFGYQKLRNKWNKIFLHVSFSKIYEQGNKLGKNGEKIKGTCDYITSILVCTYFFFHTFIHNLSFSHFHSIRKFVCAAFE